jgi:hypothetical protein
VDWAVQHDREHSCGAWDIQSPSQMAAAHMSTTKIPCYHLDVERTAAGLDRNILGHACTACTSTPTWVRGVSRPATSPSAPSPAILPFITTTTSKHVSPRSPCTSPGSEPPRQCAPRVRVLPPCVADYPIFHITCANRCGKDLGQPGHRFSPASLPRPLSWTSPAASSQLQSTWFP